MDLWHAWIGFLQAVMQTLAVNWGLGAGLAIILLTVAVRATLAPLTWSLAYRSAMRQAKLAELEPALTHIREHYAKEPQTQMQQTMALYRQHGLSVVDSKSLLGSFVQMPVIYGLYRALSSGVGTSAFLWIRNLARPDVVLAILAAISTAVAMALAPNMPEQVRLTIILLPAILCFVAALHFSSGVALYWVTSNLFGTVQTFALRQAIRRNSTR
jgi:YidC/Oxa1 family membrane protein insertase